jgi:hypothetical protein
MADSNSHKLGQIIGDTLELAIQPYLAAFAHKYSLFLDQKGPRSCRQSKKVSWTDINGSSHDLDFVLERGGTKAIQGAPVAFIETAWRRYTKHSRAKAQEIQGAIEPLVVKYRQHSPFKGIVIAGAFTDGALRQLKNLGFKIVYVPYETVVQAFALSGINVAFDEGTSERILAKKVAMCAKLSKRQRQTIANAMLRPCTEEVTAFLDGLTASVVRKVTRVTILPLFGSATHVSSIAEALAVVSGSSEETPSAVFNRYEIRIEFSNGDYVEGNFQSKSDAAAFLNLAGA